MARMTKKRTGSTVRTSSPAQVDGTRYHVPNVERALQVLEYLATHGRCSVPTLTRALNIPRMSVYRIAKTLEAHEYLLLDEDGQSFRLGRKFLTLGHAAVEEENLTEKSLDVMRDLRDRSGETVLLGTLIGPEGVVLEQVPSKRPVRFMIEIGHRFPLHTSAPGKAILAFLPETERDAILSKIKFIKYTNTTIISRPAYVEALGLIRSSGFATDDGEEYEELRCVGAPIFNHRGYPIAAVWVTAPTFRLTRAKMNPLGRMLVDKARTISGRFGYNLISSRNA